MRKIRVLQCGKSTGLFGAERWILTLIRYCDPQYIENIVMVIKDSPQGEIDLVDIADSRGFETAVLDAKGPFDPAVLLKLVRLIKEKKIDILHTHHYKSDIIGLIAAKMAGIQLVSTPHGFGTCTGFKIKLYMKLGCWFQQWADKVVPLSEGLKCFYTDTGMNSRKLHLICNGVDTLEVEEKTALKQYTDLKQKTKCKLIGYVGRLEEGKGLLYLLEAFKQIIKTIDARLILVGEGPLKSEIEKRVNDSNLQDKVELLGFREDRIEIMKCFDLFVLPSLSEGIPRVLMEAMAAGIPILSTDIPGVRELVQNNKNGLLVPAKSSEELTKGINELLSDKSRAGQLADAAYTWVLNNYSGKRMAEEYTKLFYEVIEERKSP